MTPFKKFVRNLLEKALGRFEENGDAPARLREQVIEFANYFPRATRGQWISFAAGFAEECWSAGYVRGVEWAERAQLPDGPSPEEIADEIDPTWRDRPWRPDAELQGLASYVPGEEAEPHEEMQEQARLLKAGPRRFE